MQSLMNHGFIVNKGPAVPSIVSLTRSLDKDLLSLTVLRKSIAVIFFEEKS